MGTRIASYGRAPLGAARRRWGWKKARARKINRFTTLIPTVKPRRHAVGVRCAAEAVTLFLFSPIYKSPAHRFFHLPTLALHPHRTARYPPVFVHRPSPRTPPATMGQTISCLKAKGEKGADAAKDAAKDVGDKTDKVVDSTTDATTTAVDAAKEVSSYNTQTRTRTEHPTTNTTLGRRGRKG